MVYAGNLPALRTLSVEELLLPGVDAFKGRHIRAKLLTSLSLPQTFANDAVIRCIACQGIHEQGCGLMLLHATTRHPIMCMSLACTRRVVASH